jgi:hypothetical protein
MFTRRTLMIVVMVMMLSLSLSACKWSAERNPDGSWTITGSVTEAEAQKAIDEGLADPLIKNVRVDFQPGVLAVTADRTSPDGSRTDALRFKVMLSVVNGHLGAVISDVQASGTPVDPALVAVWNQRIADRLERAGERRERSTLESVSVTDSDLTMVWHAEGRKNQ